MAEDTTPPETSATPAVPSATPPAAVVKKEAHPDAGLLGKLLGGLGIRGLFYNLGGRKVVAGGGALGVITIIVQTGMADWPKAIACLAVSIIALGTMFSISSEDAKKIQK